MLNQVVMVGRIVKDVEIKTLESGKSVSNIALAIPRPYKNEEGVYDTDFIDVTLWEHIAKNTSEYCKKGDLVGIKGRLQTNSYEKDNGTKENKLNVIAEKVTFLSSRKIDEPEQER